MQSPTAIAINVDEAGRAKTRENGGREGEGGHTPFFLRHVSASKLYTHSGFALQVETV